MIIRDPSSLDWAQWYSNRMRWPVDRDIFLADAVLRIAPMIAFPWDDDIMMGLTAPAAPLLPAPGDAFSPDGTPIVEVHEAWGPALLAYMPLAEYEAMRAVSGNPASWAVRYEPDPAGGAPRPRAIASSGDAVTISYDHWNLAAWNAAETSTFREAANIAIPHLARQIALMALEGSIGITARPIGGGEHVDVSPDDWMIDDPAARIASCTINFEAPRSTSAPATHLLFVRREGFEAAAWVHAQRAPLSLIEEGITPKDAGLTGPRPSAAWKALEDQAFRAMRSHLIANPKAYTRPDLKLIAGNISDTVFEKARNRLRLEFPYISEGGAPSGKDRRPPAGH